MSDAHTYQFVPFGDSGKGLFGQVLSPYNNILVGKVKDDIIRQARLVPLGKEETYCIGDFGCADGASTMGLMRELLSSLKELHGADTEFKIIYEDVSVNDFNSLFLRLDGIIPDPPSYALDTKNVFIHACGTSFFKQCSPSESMHVIISLFAAHWLSKRPTTYKNSVYRFPDSSEEEKNLLSKQAQMDWETFLLMRSKELKSGGRLMVVVPSDGVPNENGEFKITNGSYYRIVSSIWQNFAETGKITQNEFEETNMNTCHYNVKQLQSPFENRTSEVYISGLRFLALRDVSYLTTDYLTWKQRLDQEGIDDRKTHAKNYVKARRCYTNCAFMGGLSDSRTSEEKEELVDELFQQVEDVISRRNPEDLKNDETILFLCMYKI